MKTNLLKYATEIRNESDINVSDKENKICILFVNYNSGGYLGQPVINDCEDFAKNLIDFGYKCLFVCNAEKLTVENILKKLVSMKNKTIVFFYSGHGSTINDMDSDENDGRDESFVFKDRLFVDDEFCNLINKYLDCEKLICITDACHSGTIYDAEKVDKDKQNKITCVSSCLDFQTSKQLDKNGVFTMNFWKCFNKQTKQLDVKEINRRLDLFNQRIVMFPNSSQTIDF